MLRSIFSARTISLLLVLGLGCSLTASPILAFTLRVPQVAFSSAPLQHVMDDLDGRLNVTTSQLEAQAWSSAALTISTFTLVQKTGDAASLGIYNTLATGSPSPCLVFPSVATTEWSAECRFLSNGHLIITVRDGGDVMQDILDYPGQDRAHFGFYVTGPNGTWYSQDARNGGNAQALTYAFTFLEPCRQEMFWECFETAGYEASTSTFTGEIFAIEAGDCGFVPVRTPTWGGLKARYR